MTIQELIQKLYGYQLGRTLEGQITDAATLAQSIIERLAKVKTNSDFHQWREQVLAELRGKVANLSDVYLALAVSVAYEQYKARGQNWFVKFWQKVWGAITRVGLDAFVANYGASLLADAKVVVSEALLAQNNANIRTVRDKAFAALRAQYATAKDNWIAMLIDVAISIVVNKGVLL